MVAVVLVVEVVVTSGAIILYYVYIDCGGGLDRCSGWSVCSYRIPAPRSAMWWRGAVSSGVVFRFPYSEVL
jgi:hypothetical protein